MSTLRSNPTHQSWALPAELRAYSLLPFWFWNDAIDEAELLRQIDDFVAHGVHGFVIHPRVGLPEEIGWMSERMLQLVRFAVEAAAERAMRVVLYDEGMYPSGSSSGQVVAENPTYGCRGTVLAELPMGVRSPALPESHRLLSVFRRPDGRRYAVVNRPVDSVIRGLHYTDEVTAAEQTPPAADLLNPAAVACFIRLVYDRYFAAVGDHFGKTVVGIFTDEPDLLGRMREPFEHVRPGSIDLPEQLERLLDYDFAPHWPALWFDDVPGAAGHRAAFGRAVVRRMEETYYKPLSDWCQSHGVDLMGHPAGPDDYGLMKHFGVPGQDLVWRWVMPESPTALEGRQSTQAKCSSSAASHLGRRRNSNEFCGAYGHQLTFEQMQWLAAWCLIRGVNLLLPHAFYYSIRGPRQDERPRDVGPNSPWWDRFGPFARWCAELCRLNAESTPLADVAILGRRDRLPWEAAKVCYERQIDFQYVTLEEFADGSARWTDMGLQVGPMVYRALVVEALGPEDRPGGPDQRAYLSDRRVVEFGSAASLVERLTVLATPGFAISPPQPAVRIRRLRTDGVEHVMLFNEASEPVRFTYTAWGREVEVRLAGYAVTVLREDSEVSQSSG